MAVQSGALASELANGAPGCRFERMLTTKKTGMGMGLIISRSIVEAHGGRICAENNSSLGGARFCVTLPVIARAKPAPSAKRFGPRSLWRDFDQRFRLPADVSRLNSSSRFTAGTARRPRRRRNATSLRLPSTPAIERGAMRPARRSGSNIGSAIQLKKPESTTRLLSTVIEQVLTMTSGMPRHCSANTRSTC